MSEFEAFLKAASEGRHAPYNFIPIPDVAMPSPIYGALGHGEDGAQVPFDRGRPLDGAVSGSLDVRWTALTPLLVGGAAENDARDGSQGSAADFATFRRSSTDPVIPGASLRGLIRATLEIAAFGRLNFVDLDRFFATRDFNKHAWTSVAGAHAKAGGGRYIDTAVPVPATSGSTARPTRQSGGRQGKGPGVKAGWVEWDRTDVPSWERKLVLRPVTWAPVPVTGLDRQFGKRLQGVPWNEASFDAKRAAVGYEDGVEPITVTLASEQSATGVLVFTGVVPAGGKRSVEALFPLPDDAIKPIPLHPEVMEQFATSQRREGRLTKPKTDSEILACNGIDVWEFWHHQLFVKDRPIPVFYLGDPTAAQYGAIPPNTRPASTGDRDPVRFFFSLSRFFRIPSRYSVRGLIEQGTGPIHRSVKRPDGEPGLDLVEALFGMVQSDALPAGAGVKRATLETPLNPDGSPARAGRVMFRHAELTRGQSPRTVRHRILAMTPSPSFYPFYIRHRAELQGTPDSVVDHPVDWNNKDARPAGRKRYPARRTAQPPPAPQSADERKQFERLASDLTFLTGSSNAPLTFDSKIRFRNLLPAELGAIVWALTLGEYGADTPTRCHQIGRAKAYGFGRVQATVTAEPAEIRSCTGGAAPDLATCVAEFEKVVLEWANREEIRDKLGVGDQPVDRLEAIPTIAQLLAMVDPRMADAIEARNDRALGFPRFRNGRDPYQPLPGPNAKADNDADDLIKAYVRLKTKAGNEAEKRAAATYTLPLYPTDRPS